jgi:hypothetical protein
MIRLACLVAVVASAAWAQDGAHWGVQADGGYFFVPEFVVEKIETLPEIPSIEGAGYQAGVVRFNARGAPNYAFQYSQIRAGIEGSISDPRGRAGVSGAATLRGLMVTKYWNFFTARRASAGVATGGGIGKLDAWYTRTVSSPTAIVFFERLEYDYTIPMFEILARADFRVAGRITVGPFYGIRNGMLGGGAAVRIHLFR